MCHPHPASHHYAQGHPAGQTNLRRESVKDGTTKNKHFGPFQDHPHTPKGVAFEKLKDLCYRLNILVEGKYAQNTVTNSKS